MANVTYEIYIDWDNDGSVLSGAFEANENVSADVLGLRTPISWSYGRDTARSLAEIEPGSATLELDNISKIYSPDNASGALFGFLGPGKPVLIRSIHSAVTRNLFWGFIDDYNIDPFRESRSVTITVIDALAKLAETMISTPLYEGITTGQAIGYALDAAGWPATQRDLDSGATTIRYWWEDDKGVLDAIKDIVSSEGGPAIAYVDPVTANFTFRDRHHRFLDTTSITSQATFSDTGSEPLFCDPVDYNIGFKDLVNSVGFNIDEREPDIQAVVWTTEDVISLAAGEVVVLNAVSDDPFQDAVTPVVDIDYKVLSGSVTVSLDRNSGQSLKVTLAAASASYVSGLQVRATPITVARTYSISAVSNGSIDKYGKTSWSNEAPPWAGRHDAQAIADIIIGLRSERLPVMSITVNNGNDTRKVQQLSRKLSERITIVEAQTGTNHDHFIERVEHDIQQVGEDHRVTFGCERVLVQASPVFTFTSVSGNGFDQGKFSLSGYDSSASIFILGSAVSGHRLGTGNLGT